VVGDIDDDRPPGGIRPIRPGAVPPANDPVKQPEARQLTEKVAELTAVLLRAQAEAAVAEANVERAAKLFDAGAVTAEEFAKLKENAEIVRKAVRTSEAELKAAQSQLDAANKAPGKEPTPRRPQK
jgi:multidrug resistance efflux pump